MSVLIADFKGQMLYPGCMTGNVSVAESSGDFLGASHTSSDVAELHGLAWALIYLLQFNGSIFQSVEVCFDSTYAHGTACAFYSSQHNVAIATIVAGLQEMVQTITSISWRHEPSHEGLPFNELADTAAKWQRRHLESGHLRSPASEWAMAFPAVLPPGTAPRSAGETPARTSPSTKIWAITVLPPAPTATAR